MLSILVAMDKNNTIGKNNQLPWHLPADLAYFKRITMGHSIVMGRKTFESIGKPLPGRKNIILTRDSEYQAEGCHVIHSISAIKEMNKKTAEIFIIGGAELFNQTLSFVDKLYITEIESTFEGDTFFPSLDESEWSLVSKEKGKKDEKNPYDYYFSVYERG